MYISGPSFACSASGAISTSTPGGSLLAVASGAANNRQPARFLLQVGRKESRGYPGCAVQAAGASPKAQPFLAPRARLMSASRCIRMTQGRSCCCCCCCGGRRSATAQPSNIPLYRELIGNTPLVDLSSLSSNPEVRILGKCEFTNPSGSIKDRMALHALTKAEQEGKLQPGGTIVAATSGNTGTAVAMIAAMKDYKYIVITNEKTSKEKVDAMKLYGGEVIIGPSGVPADHPDHYQNMATTMCVKMPEYYDLDQYNNPANAEAYYCSLGPEIWEQTEGCVTHLVAGGSTGGTITGTGRYLREMNPNTEVVLPDPVGSVFYDFWMNGVDEKELKTSSYQLEGVGKDSTPGAMDFSVVTDMMQVTDKQATLMCHRLAHTEGLMTGSSSGLNMYAAVELSRSAPPGSVIVVILPDSGIKYLSKFYNPEWCKAKGLDAASEDRQAHLLQKKPAVKARELALA